MEPLVALSLACNVMQVILFGTETVRLCKRIYRTGSPDVSIEEYGANLAQLSSSLGAQLQRKPKPLQNWEQELLDISEKCEKAATDLQNTISSLSIHGSSSRWRATLKMSPKVIWRRHQLEQREKSLSSYQRTMETSILVDICAKMELSQVQQQDGFAKLGFDLQYFIQKISKGQTGLSELVIRQGDDLKALVTNEALQTTRSVTAQLGAQLTAGKETLREHIAVATGGVHESLSGQLGRANVEVAKKRIRERFLSSLKFPDMNERKNQITNSLHLTFHWIFNIKVDDSNYRPPPWDDFVRWLESDQRLYWISGKPGSGKSTLMKFIVTWDGAASTTLEKWHEGTQILTHFMWSPGHIMQRSIKGLLSSLLHQALEANFSLDIFKRDAHLQSKESTSDWAVDELRAVALEILGASSQAYCLFLDGLDEICPEDGLEDLMMFIQELASMPRVKVCVASRPEAVVQRRLDKYPSLKIQDLTAGDLRRYAQTHLQEYLGSQNFSRHLAETLLLKSQGVFLWVVLAVRSLRRGLDNNDSMDQLNYRLDQMPTDLAQLYENMWLKLNDDREIYRQTAALYFRLLLVNREEKFECTLDNEISVFEIAAAFDDGVQDTLFNTTEPPTEVRMKEMCEATMKNIEIRCGGFLEFTSPREPTARSYEKRPWVPDDEGPYVASETESDDSNHKPEDENFSRPSQYFSTDGGVPFPTIAPYAQLSVDFIHRTAFDFFADTTAGQNILEASPDKCQALVRLFKGCLLRCQLWVLVRYDSIFEGPGALDNDVKDFVLTISRIKERLDEEAIMHLLSLCQEAYTAGYLRSVVPAPSQPPFRYYKTSFFAIVAALPLPGMVRKHLESLTGNVSWNPRYLTLLLGGASDFRTGTSGDSSLQDRCRLVRLLLQLGADPNHPQHTLGLRNVLNKPCSPFTRALETILNLQECRRDSRNYPRDGSDYRRLSEEISKTLDAFAISGAKLNTPTLMTFIVEEDNRPRHRSELLHIDITFESGFGPHQRFVILETISSLFVDCINHRLHPDVTRNSQILEREPFGERSSPKYVSSRSRSVDRWGGDGSLPVRPVRIISIGDISRPGSYILESEEDSEYLLELISPWFTNEQPFHERGSGLGVRYPDWNQTFNERFEEVLRRSNLSDVTRKGLGRYLHGLGYRIPAHGHDFEDIPHFL